MALALGESKTHALFCLYNMNFQVGPPEPSEKGIVFHSHSGGPQFFETVAKVTSMLYFDSTI